VHHPIEPFARYAYAAGWASVRGPMTTRVRVGCAAAVAVAVEHADDPQILETTLQLGKLEGMWAVLFDRRERLIRQYTATVNDAWRRLIKPRTLRDGLHNLRAELGLTEAQQRDQQQVKAACLAAARAMLQALPVTAGWAALRAALRDALAAGRAEGIVAAVAIAAERAQRAGLDWDAGFARAYQQLESLGSLWSEAEIWQQRLLDRAVADLTRVLAEQVARNASFEEMLAAAHELLDSDDFEAVDFTTDWAMTTAAGQGAFSLYQLQDIATITWVTAGDGRVCEDCQDAEDNSPWPLPSAPTVPMHPRCRCQTTADLDLTAMAAWFTDT
jgi:hypothetical protein